MQKSNRVQGAIEEIRSAMSAARIKAQTSGQEQAVGVDFDGERFISTVWGGSYAGGAWTGSWRNQDGVDLLAGTSTCQASTATGIKTFIFSSRGTVSVTGGGASKTVMARTPGNAGSRMCLVVNTVTGRARVVTP
ncbi:MAG: hypothetical protein D6794_11435 [Deltaproteobacteria bacterium]|nr:MAG: hypothetical protein D6794_11435 [Deltaproteobacteria bacterium]